MSDGLKFFNDMRHRSSSSLSGVILEGTRSEKKLDIRASIQEVDSDQFALAEARCNDLQEKIDLVKVLRKKRKLKKKSMTRVSDPLPISENVPFISVKTQPKKKVSQQAARLRRLEVPANPTRGYLDPATVEQHRMIGQFRSYKPDPQPKQRYHSGEFHISTKVHAKRASPNGDTMTCGDVYGQTEVACGDDDVLSDQDLFNRQHKLSTVSKRRHGKSPPTATFRRRHVPMETISPKETKEDVRIENTNVLTEERSVIELFSKIQSGASPVTRYQAPPMANRINKKVQEFFVPKNENTGPLNESITADAKKEKCRHPRRVKYRSRRYELPTVASQMKQTGMRYYYENANATNIPFIASKSTTPSHNIGVNIQQVLNGVKIQQPLSGIPLTIAHHMGLGHVPTHSLKSTTMRPSLDNREINVIKLGSRLLRLPSYRYMSYNRLLNMYREGEGMVPRFLRAISRPHYFYTSMYNLATHQDDQDGATSKGRGAGQDAKQSLAEYASLYRELEQIEQCMKGGSYDPELECRREVLTKELTTREEHIRRVVQEYRSSELDQSTLRASASIADDAYRHSTFKLNVGDHPQQ